MFRAQARVRAGTPLIVRAASAFRVCGDWSQGVARIRCPSCGFDRHDTFFFIPLGATAALIEIWRRSVVALFLEKGLLNPDFARKILAWQHAGFSIESGTRILEQPTREALCQYLVRAPLSLRRIRRDEGQDTVTWSASPSGFFKGGVRHYSSLDFIAQVTLHVP